MKKEIGANDAIEHESAGAAYVENFALRVFKLADEEDRRAEATRFVSFCSVLSLHSWRANIVHFRRSTAKKFLAAANFLELLKVFEKSNNAVVVRYFPCEWSD